VLGLIVLKRSNALRSGSLNAFRLANKRCKEVVRACTTRLTNDKTGHQGSDSLPIHIMQRCRGIEMKRLEIGDAPASGFLFPHLTDLHLLIDEELVDGRIFHHRHLCGCLNATAGGFLVRRVSLWACLPSWTSRRSFLSLVKV
jgi:hypothetical protein